MMKILAIILSFYSFIQCEVKENSTLDALNAKDIIPKKMNQAITKRQRVCQNI